MIKCPKCGNELTEGTKFCTGCGANIKELTEDISNSAAVCSVCGAKLKPNAKFCTSCGTPVETQEKQTVTEMQTEVPQAESKEEVLKPEEKTEASQAENKEEVPSDDMNIIFETPYISGEAKNVSNKSASDNNKEGNLLKDTASVKPDEAVKVAVQASGNISEKSEDKAQETMIYQPQAEKSQKSTYTAPLSIPADKKDSKGEKKKSSAGTAVIMVLMFAIGFAAGFLVKTLVSGGSETVSNDIETTSVPTLTPVIEQQATPTPTLTPTPTPAPTLTPTPTPVLLSTYEPKTAVILGQYENLTVETEVSRVTEEAIDTEIEYLMEQFIDYEPIVDKDNPDLEDILQLTIVSWAAVPEEDIDGYFNYEYVMTAYNELSDMIPTEVYDAAMGLKVGESTQVTLVIPEGYTGREDIDGKEVVFEVTLNGIYFRFVPELTDEFVANSISYMYEGCTNIADLREAIANDLAVFYNETAASKAQDAALKLAMDNAAFGNPAAEDIAVITDELRQQYLKFAQSIGMDYEEYIETAGVSVEEFEKMLTAQAEQEALYRAFAHAVLADKEIVLLEDEFEELVDEYLGSWSAEEYLQYYPKEQLVEAIIGGIAENYIYATMTINYVEADESISDDTENSENPEDTAEENGESAQTEENNGGN